MNGAGQKNDRGQASIIVFGSAPQAWRLPVTVTVTVMVMGLDQVRAAWCLVHIDRYFAKGHNG